MAMTRVIIRFKDGEHINIPADAIDIRDEWIVAWKGDFIVAMAKAEEIISCHLSETKE
jgi:hypothetical protein